MSFDLGMIFADIASAIAVSLMVLVLKKLSDFNHRIQRIETDLYVAGDNPTSMPLTKQVYTLQQDVATIKENCERLNVTMGNINTTIRDCFTPSPKRKKGGRV